jgi:hypothetical protein
MAVGSGDLQLWFSGGAGNTVGNACLGGARSTAAQVGSDVNGNLFDIVTADQANTGIAEYRCVYVRNNNGTSSWTNVKYWIESDSSGQDKIAIAIGTSAINGTEQTIANEKTAPTGVTWSETTSYSNGLVVGTLTPNQHKAVWMRRTVPPDCTAEAGVYFAIRFEGKNT